MSKLASDSGYNPFHTIDDLPLTDDQKEMVLEWYARKLYEAGSGRRATTYRRKVAA